MFPKTKEKAPAMPEVKEMAIEKSFIIELAPEVKALQKAIFNMKFDYDALLNFIVDMLTHEQHVKFVAKKKEIFG